MAGRCWRRSELDRGASTAVLRNDAAAKALLRWAVAERETWLDAVTNDPLLPGRILPCAYLGQQAWRL